MARSVLGDDHRLTLRLRWHYARALYENTSATLDDLRDAVTTLEDTDRTARQVLGGTHPTTMGIECGLREARDALAVRSVCEAVDAANLH